jgi:hypothetical protein
MADENSIIKVNNTTYSIQEKWLETAKKFFEVDDNDELNINLLKAGLFGYNNEIMSSEIKNNVYHRNVLYDEHFLNTASIPKSIYNHAKMQNTDVDSAVPSHMRINFGVKKSDITSSSKFTKIKSNDKTDADSSYEFVIDNSFVFTLGEYNFMLPFPVQLVFTVNNINSEYTVTARYLYDQSQFPFYKVKNPYIKLWEEVVGGVRYIFLDLDIYQVEKETTTVTVTSEDISENLFYDVNYTDQMAYFNVFYTYNGERELLNTYFNNTFTPGDDEKYCYYTFIDDNKLEVSFSALPNSFRPRYNSTLEIEVYTTSGSAGNFSYSGDVRTNYIEDTAMNKIPVFITPITDASGGKDRPTYIEMKQKLLDEYLLRDNLVTEGDLDKYFNQVSSNESINGSQMKFIKKRDDVIKRLWNSYLLLRNTEGNVIPTTTIPKLFINNAELESNNYTIPEGSAVVYDIANDTYFIVWHKLELEDYLDRSKYLIYAIPYLVKVEQNPVLASVYYKTYVQEEAGLSYKYLNPNVPYQFLVNAFEVSRDNMSSEVYTFRLSLVTNLIDTEFDQNVKVRAILRGKSGETYGYFDLNRTSDTELTYEGYLATEKWNTIVNNKMNIYNSLYTLDSSAVLDNDGLTSVRNALVEGEVDIELAIMYKNDFTTERVGDTIRMPDMEGYATACLMTNDDPIELFSNMSNVIESNVYPSDTGFTFRSIPLVEYTYFQYNYPLVYDLMNRFVGTLRDNVGRLENITSVDVKFFNTYGKSRWYYSDRKWNQETRQYDFEMVKRVDLDVSLNVYVNNVVTGETDLAIKKYISDFIEASNDEGIFPLSNLTRRLEENFEIIRYIVTDTINDLPVQKIESKYTSHLEMTKQEVIDYVPEYLNLRKELTAAEGEYGVEQFYMYAVTINYL